MKNKFSLNIKVFSSVFTTIFIIFAFVDFGSRIKRGNDLYTPPSFFQIIYTVLFCWESIL